MDAFSVLDIQTRVDADHVAKLDSEVVSGDLVHLNLTLFNIIGAQADKYCIMPLLSSEGNNIQLAHRNTSASCA